MVPTTASAVLAEGIAVGLQRADNVPMDVGYIRQGKVIAQG